MDTENTEDIIRYLYQHTVYDKMSGNPLSEIHDNNAIYCHDTDYIGHSIYEDLSKTII